MKKVISLILVTSFPFFCFSCKKDQPKDISITSTITFISGDVTVTGKQGTKIAAKAGCSIQKGDTLTTGEKASAIIQLADEAVIKILEKSTITFEALENSQRTMAMTSGVLVGKVKKLNKNNGFLIKLPTTVASVRGTNFMISSNDKGTSVAVTEGKVAVAENEIKLNLPETVIVDTDKTAQTVTGKNGVQEISLRSATKEETSAVNVIIDIPLIPDAEKKTETELNTIVAPFAKDVPVTTKNDKQTQILKSSQASLSEIKEAFNRIDEITLYNNKVISGIIISRGETFTIVTPSGKISLKQKEIMRTRVVQ